MVRVACQVGLSALLLIPTVLSAKTLKTLYTFMQPFDAQGEFAADRSGLLYGTSAQGGSAGLGTVFSFNPKTKALTILYNFQGGSDGASPVAGMVLSKGVLIGATALGGSTNDGTVFAFDTKTGTERVLHSFSGPDGQAPQYPPAIADDGTLYGTTSVGGKSNDGVVYKLDQHSGAEKVLFQFNGTSDSDHPNALTVGPSGLLYGSCNGGNFYHDYGNLFTLDPGTGAFTLLYTFVDEAAAQPSYALILGQDGLIYGSGSADAFQFNTVTGAITDLGAYAYGQTPSGRLVTDDEGNLYGVTLAIGAGGTVFEFDVGTNESRRLWTFDGQEAHHGAYPYGVVFGKSGSLYGTTEISKIKGKPAYGTIFSLVP